jgi:hypothetical protein
MKHCILAILLTLLVSCNSSNHQTEDLKKQIGELQKQNKKLKDSLSKTKEIDLKSRILIGIPDGKVKVGKENRIVFLLHKYYNLPKKYEIFKVEDGKEVKIGSSNSNQFDYQFKPKSIKDNNFKIKVKIPYKGKVIEIPGEMILEVEK